MGQGKSLQELMAEMSEKLDEHAEQADMLAAPLLESITKQADELTNILDKLKLTDPDTYDALKNIVNAETKKNIAIANIVDNLKALGKKGAALAGHISKLSGAGALASLGKALGKKK